MGKVDISSIIQKDREERKNGVFQGNFLDYLELVKQNPDIPMLAHQRMYNIITEPGVEVIKTEISLSFSFNLWQNSGNEFEFDKFDKKKREGI